jgi:hypothetical protein
MRLEMRTERGIALQPPEGVGRKDQVTRAFQPPLFELADGLLAVDGRSPEILQEVPALSPAVVERRGVSIIGDQYERLRQGDT